MQHTFLYISLPSLHDYNVNCLISCFIVHEYIRRRISLSSPAVFNGQSERVKIITLKFQRIRSGFLGDIFTAVAFVVFFVEVQKFCHHSNLMSHFSSLLCLANKNIGSSFTHVKVPFHDFDTKQIQFLRIIFAPKFY